ncbi:hypothetical protein L596_007357 [Steinernema carpocapsae]|uniref:Uncharacterized protein n=1 Tax=Steinernema carpocapsae TaxID=34508 RepID=A0A4U5P910_STECR|nr:hypothetical protein L596_007357 [Steinernema carpocapsae]
MATVSRDFLHCFYTYNKLFCKCVCPRGDSSSPNRVFVQNTRTLAACALLPQTGEPPASTTSLPPQTGYPLLRLLACRRLASSDLVRSFTSAIPICGCTCGLLSLQMYFRCPATLETRPSSLRPSHSLIGLSIRLGRRPIQRIGGV